MLHATRIFAEGDVILVESPLHIVKEEPTHEAFRHVQKLCADFEPDFDYEPLWYWCALCSLTSTDLKGVKHGGWPAADSDTQHNLLLLHHDEIRTPCNSSKILARELCPGADPLLIERLIQIWVLNCFEYSDNPQGFSTYFFSSFMSHSCWPNAVWHYTGADHVLRARREIRIGDEVCISYLPEHGLLQSAPVRRMELHDTKRFWCNCDRCQSGKDDLSRGFLCPKCGKGTVFARTPPDGPAKASKLNPEPLVGAACRTCGYKLDKRDSTRLVGHEKQLTEIISKYAKRAEKGAAGTTDVKDLKSNEDFVDAAFAQHVLADSAWEQFADCYNAKDMPIEQRRLFERRVSFHADSYPGLNGSHAWTLESYGDLMLHGTRGGRSPKKKRSKGHGTTCTKEVLVNSQEALKLYIDSHRMLHLMFGADHEYVTQVDHKIKAARQAVAARQDVADSVALEVREKANSAKIQL